jgi:Uma2 family endonuclease
VSVVDFKAMATDPNSTYLKLTYEDYLSMPDDGRRHELVDGEHYMTPSPSSRHQGVLGNLYLGIGSFLRKNNVGKLYLAPLDVILSQFDVVQPDLLFISTARLGILSDGYVRGVPDLVVEILSPSSMRHDAIRKRHLYEKFGVGEFWLIDPERDEIEVFRLVDGTLKKQLELTLEQKDVLTSPLFPGLRIPLADILEP